MALVRSGLLTTTFKNEGLEDGGDGPGIGGGFDGGHAVLKQVGFGEGFESGAGGREAGTEEDLAVFIKRAASTSFLWRSRPANVIIQLLQKAFATVWKTA